MTDKSLLVSALAVAALFGLAVWWEVSVWNECRQTHSFSYCLYIQSKN